jgi:hypothetical protein
MIKYHQIR